MPTSVAAPAPAAPAAPASTPAPSVAKSNPVVPSSQPTHGGNTRQPQNGGTPAPRPEGTTPAAVAARLSRKMMVDGKEQELSATEDELFAAFSQRSVAGKRFEEGARLRKEAAEETRRNQETMAKLADPRHLMDVFMKANPDADPVEVLASILQERMLEEEQLQDPNIKERRRLESENKKYKTAEQEARQAAEHAQVEEETQTEMNRIAGSFVEALKMTKLPSNDITVKLMAEAEASNRRQGWDLTPEQLARATEKSVHSLIESVLSNESTTDDQLLSAFPVLTKRIHKAIVARFKSRGSTQNAQPSDVTPRERRPSAEEPRQRIVSSIEEHKAFGGKGLRTL